MVRSNSRRRIAGAAALVLLAAAGAARGQGQHTDDSDRGGHGSGGNPPPLMVVDIALSGSGRATWSAPTDVDTLGGPAVAAGAYAFYLSPSPITTANLAGATLIPLPFAPGLPDAAEEFWIPGLTPGQTVYIAIRSSDSLDATQWSALNATDAPVVIEAPQDLQGLHSFSPTETSISFAWDSPGLSDRDNVSNEVRLRLSRGPAFATYQEFPIPAGTWMPIEDGGHAFDGLEPGTIYYCSASVRNPSGLVRAFPATGVPGETLASLVTPPPPPEEGASGRSCGSSAPALAAPGIAVLAIALVVTLRLRR